MTALTEELADQCEPVQLSEEAHGPGVFVCAAGHGRWPCLRKRASERIVTLEAAMREALTKLKVPMDLTGLRRKLDYEQQTTNAATILRKTLEEEKS